MKSLYFTFIFVVMLNASAFGFSFSQDPESWTDAEVESFLYLSQVQKKTGLSKNSNLCIDISGPVQGGRQRMRMISKIGDNSNGGLFQVGKAQIATEGSARNDLNTIKTIVDMSSGYQRAIMDYDASQPVAKDAVEAKKYMSAEVIGYTDGLGINGTLNASLEGSPAKSYSSNKQLGMLRADYLSKELDLPSQVASVKKTSKQSETALKDPKYESIRNCDTWRTAEVRMYFQTGSMVTDDRTWSMSTMMMESRERAMLQFEASRQVAEALRKLSNDILSNEVPSTAPAPSPQKGSKSVPESRPLVKVASDESKDYCDAVLKSMQGWKMSGKGYNFEACKVVLLPTSCRFECGDLLDGNVNSVSVSLGNSGADFSNIGSSIYNIFLKTMEDKQTYHLKERDFDHLKVHVSRDQAVIDKYKVLVNLRKDKMEEHLKASFPECAKDPTSFQDLKDLVSRVVPAIRKYEGGSLHSLFENVDKAGYGRIGKTENGSFKINDELAEFVKAAAPNAKVDGSGAVIRGLKCLNMKRIMRYVYNKGECKGGDEFSKVNFPHKNVVLGCVYCGSGWKTKNGIAFEKERDTLVETQINPHDHGKTFSSATVEALRSPGVHEIANCPDCNCTDKAEKLSKIYTVEKAGDGNLVPSINPKNCYCTPPVAPSCGVGPSGKTDESKVTSLGQKYFFDACSGKFEKITGDTKTAQIQNLLNQFNKGCSTDPANCASTEISAGISKVNAMLCEKQGYRIPSDDPIKDCSQEDQ